jgi:putative phosphoribosyl transferase
MLAARRLTSWPAKPSVGTLLYGVRTVFCADERRPAGRIVKDTPCSPRGELLVVTGLLATRVRRVPARSVARYATDGVRLALTRSEFLALPGYVPDDELHAAVRRSLGASERLRNFGLGSIEVAARDGDVVLSGYVPDAGFRAEIELRARMTWGVLSVENRLITDRDLEIAVSRAFTVYPELQPSLVRVDAQLGSVILQGELPISLAELARSVAERVSGVAKVESRIVSRFRDRADAGRQLAERLLRYRGRTDVLVVALAREGIPVGSEVAQTLRVPIDVLAVRKLRLPGAEHSAAGAIAPGGVRVLNQEVVRRLRVRQDEIERICALAQMELDQDELSLVSGRSLAEATDKTVVLVDDGIETGSTMRAAIAAVRQHYAREVVIAVPVAPASVCSEIAGLADRVVCLEQPEQLGSFDEWYRGFRANSDAGNQGLPDSRRVQAA